jgi:hypothetical protein
LVMWLMNMNCVVSEFWCFAHNRRFNGEGNVDCLETNVFQWIPRTELLKK